MPTSPPPGDLEKIRDSLLKCAESAMRHAYAPYSGFRVGAAVMLEGGEIHAGCNVENASYGLTICAERNAVFSAVAGHSGKPKIVGVVVTNEKGIPCSPCGACRQVIAEFGPEAWVWYLGENGMVCKTARELLPDGFIFDRA